jgi:DNA-binding protein HU-beta
MANVTKSDLAAELAERVGNISKPTAEAAITALFQGIKGQVEAGKTVNITGFGRFAMVDRPAREARNPRTGETIQIAAKRSLKFKAAKARA